MVKINGRELTREELLKRCGSINQVTGYRRYAFSEGRGKNVEAVEINNGNGLRFTILLDRNLDIAWCDYGGINISYMSKNSIVSSSLSETHGREWLRSFPGGLLSTCGITHAGADCTDEGEELGLHGRIGVCPADNLCCEGYWDKDDYIIRVSGSTYETALFGENLVLHREIMVKAGENKIYLHDRIENLGFKKTPVMMIYHMNFGFPLLDEHSDILIDSYESFAVSEEAERKKEEKFRFAAPQHGIEENVYFHKIKNKGGYGIAALMNETLMKNGLGVYVKFDLEELPYLNQWKMPGEGDYVLGLEPSNCMTLGRDKARQRGELKYINPGEVKDLYIEIGIIENINEFINNFI